MHQWQDSNYQNPKENILIPRLQNNTNTQRSNDDIFIIMDNTNIAKSFQPQKELNPKIWEEVDGEYKMNPNVRKGLLKVVSSFYDTIKVDFLMDDVILTGSLANYNWSEYSDFDLHLLVDFDQFKKSEHEVLKNLFDSKKLLYNLKHTIKIKNYPVEVYVQDIDENHTSGGVYSLMYDKWLVEPQSLDVEVDENEIISKSKHWMDKIDTLENNIKSLSLDKGKKLISKLKDQLKNYRKSGLEKDEMSLENLVYKFLRRRGYLEKLIDLPNQLETKKLSVEKETIESKE
jgi:hypothetical protein